MGMKKEQGEMRGKILFSKKSGGGKGKLEVEGKVGGKQGEGKLKDWNSFETEGNNENSLGKKGGPTLRRPKYPPGKNNWIVRGKRDGKVKRIT